MKFLILTALVAVAAGQLRDGAFQFSNLGSVASYAQSPFVVSNRQYSTGFAPVYSTYRQQGQYVRPAVYSQYTAQPVYNQYSQYRQYDAQPVYSQYTAKPAVYSQYSAQPAVYSQYSAQPAVYSQYTAKPAVYSQYSAQPAVYSQYSAKPAVYSQYSAKPAVYSQYSAKPAVYSQYSAKPAVYSQYSAQPAVYSQYSAKPAVVAQQFTAQPAVVAQQYASAFTGPQWRILSQVQEADPAGPYRYSYATENGIQAEEQGSLVPAADGQAAVAAQGAYSYTGPDGQVYSVSYVADENGFRAVGDHLPTPPPIPAEIARSLELNAREERSQQGQQRYDDQGRLLFKK